MLLTGWSGSKAAALRRLVAEKTVAMPGAFNAPVAMMAERTGFEAVYISGAGLVNGTGGYPDVGLLGMDEMAREAGYIANADAIRAKGVDSILCVSVNDAFVMGAWGKERGAGEAVTMIADGNGDLSKALGLDFDGSGIGFGIRSQRYAAIVEDGVVTKLAVEEPMKFDVSSAEAILAAL